MSIHTEIATWSLETSTFAVCGSKDLAYSVSREISVVYQGIMKGIVNGIIMFYLARQRSFMITNDSLQELSRFPDVSFIYSIPSHCGNPARIPLVLKMGGFAALSVCRKCGLTSS